MKGATTGSTAVEVVMLGERTVVGLRERVAPAGQLAAAIGIELTDEHWRAIRFLRDDFRTTGATATLRRVATVGGIPTHTLFALFPKKPAKKMACIAGLPKPHGYV